MLAVTVSTALVSGSIFILSQYTYNKNHEQAVNLRHQQYKQAFSSVITQLKHKETELSWLIPSLIGLNIPTEQVLTNIAKQMNDQWYKVELESDVQSIFLFDTKSQLKGEWGGFAYRRARLHSLLSDVIEKEQTQSKIVCDINCFQYHALPFLHDGKFAGIFVFASSVNDIVLQMKGITNADIGILVNMDHTRYDHQQSNLPLWSLKIPALTDFSKNYRLLEALQRSFPNTIPEKSKSYLFNGNTYNIFIIPFTKDSSLAKLVIIDNVTDALLKEQKANNLYIISGVSSIALSGLLLFLLFIRTTVQLKKIITLLPLLAEKKYDEVERSLPKSRKNPLFKDEVDILDSATHHLIATLTQLDKAVEQKNLKLTKHRNELQSERNFVTKILDNAHVIITRLNQLGHILSINHYGEKLIGYDEASLINKHLFTALINDNDHKSLDNIIVKLLTDQQSTHQHNSTLFSSVGKKLYISWFFTVIQNIDAQPEILVVGLDLTDRREVETKLVWLADHDPLTKLFNRRRFEHELHRVATEASRFKHHCALIFFDVDQFKYINDSSGHQTGDKLLIQIADKLNLAVREIDIIARLGGDEFVILSPQITQKDAESLIDKIFSYIMGVEIVLGEILHKVTISAGLLMFPIESYTEQDLMASVDVAMYKAKTLGRGQWCLASPDDMEREEAKSRANWKSKIEKSLANNKFILYFQPIMRIVDKKISHYECLLRMVDDNGAIIAPTPFITIAEQTGLIKHIDKITLEMAFKQQQQFINKGVNITLSVNLSGDFLSNPNAFQICTTLLNQYNVQANQFIFEVTETQAVTNLQSAHDFATQLIAIGGQFALDDFGVGFSSMNYLKKLPVHYIKIDGEFIKELPHSFEDRLFVKAINEVGQGMKIKTIAEFVENDEILDKLLAIGVDYAQGYGIGKPMPYPEFH